MKKTLRNILDALCNLFKPHPKNEAPVLKVPPTEEKPSVPENSTPENNGTIAIVFPKNPEGKFKHENNGDCLKCNQIINEFPGAHRQLILWFKALQKKHPEFHTNCVGRGKAEQTQKVKEGKSKAPWTYSSHNYNCAIDLWVQKDGKYTLPKDLFEKVMKQELLPWLKWYGSPGSSFYELPHVEVSSWKELKAKGQVKLVE